MAFVPRRNKFSYRIPVLDGGLNTKYTDSATPDNFTPDALNVVYDDYGAVYTAYGYMPYNTAPIASAPIDGLHSYYQDSGDASILAACGGSLHEASGTTFHVVSGSTSLYASGVDVSMITAKDYVVIANGANTLRKWDNYCLTTLGVPAPTGTATAAVNSAGTLTGEYRYALTGVNTYNVESDYAIITTYLTAASSEILLTDIPLFPASAGVTTTKYLYRNTAGVSSIFYRVTALTSTQTAYTDIAADADLKTEAPEDNGIPPYLKWMVYYRGRLFGAGNPAHPSRLYYSNAADPEVWPSTNFFDVNDGDGRPITGLAMFQNSLTIHKNNGAGTGAIWMLYMPDSEDVSGTANWYLFQTPSAYSGEGHKSLAFFNDWLGYLNRYGWYAFNGSNLAMSSANSDVGVFSTDSHSFNIEPDIQSFDKSRYSHFASITYDNKVWIAVNTSIGAGYNDRVYVYDFVRASSQDRSTGAWSKMMTIPANNFVTHDGLLLAGSSASDGYVWKMNSGRNFNGEAINSYQWSVPIDGIPEHADYTKVFRKVSVLLSLEGDWNLIVDYKTDYSNTNTTQTTVSQNPGGGLWNSLVWGTGLWGGGQSRTWVEVYLINAVGKFIQFKFSTNSVDQWFKVHEIEVDYNLRSQR